MDYAVIRPKPAKEPDPLPPRQPPPPPPKPPAEKPRPPPLQQRSHIAAYAAEFDWMSHPPGSIEFTEAKTWRINFEDGYTDGCTDHNHYVYTPKSHSHEYPPCRQTPQRLPPRPPPRRSHGGAALPYSHGCMLTHSHPYSDHVVPYSHSRGGYMRQGPPPLPPPPQQMVPPPYSCYRPLDRHRYYSYFSDENPQGCSTM